MISVATPVLDECPTDPERWRLSALVDDGGGAPEPYWIEGPGPARDVDASGTPWSVALAPLAASLGTPLRIDAEVDPVTAAGVESVSRVWSSWYGGLAPVRIEADAHTAAGTARAGAAGIFFSGGVDSTYTALRHRSPEGRPAGDLVSVHGFDIPLARGDAYLRMIARFRDRLSPWGFGVATLASNYRETRSGGLPWGPLAHGCALVAAGLALGGRYGCLRIAATGGVRDPHPWGSHLDSDPLLGTSRTRVEHDGADAARWEKVQRIVADPVGLSALRVCWRSGSDENCGSCSKCLRTMALLDLWGALERAPTFPERLPLDALARVRVDERWDVREFRDLVELGATHGRPDLARAAAEAMRRGRRRARALGLVDRLTGAPGIGATARRMRERLLREGIP